MTPERIRTGIIVSVVVGTFAALILAYVVLRWRRNKGVKAGSIAGRHADERRGRGQDDKDLETGVIQEPLPVYAKDAGEDERRIAGGREEVGR